MHIARDLVGSSSSGRGQRHDFSPSGGKISPVGARHTNTGTFLFIYGIGLTEWAKSGFTSVPQSRSLSTGVNEPLSGPKPCSWQWSFSSIYIVHYVLAEFQWGKNIVLPPQPHDLSGGKLSPLHDGGAARASGRASYIATASAYRATHCFTRFDRHESLSIAR